MEQEQAFDFAEHPHRRYNHLCGEWVLVSPHRAKRPWQGQLEECDNTPLPTHSEDCYLCPGNTRINGESNPHPHRQIWASSAVPTLPPPEDEQVSQHWQLHAHFYPPLLRSASIRKFMVGYEMLSEAQRDLTPEQAAEKLRSLPDLHFRAAVVSGNSIDRNHQ